MIKIKIFNNTEDINQTQSNYNITLEWCTNRSNTTKVVFKITKVKVHTQQTLSDKLVYGREIK